MTRLVSVLLIIATMAMPAVAFGQTAAEGYSDVAGVTSGGGKGSASGSLPFTGFEVAFVLGAGLVLLATGLLLRRARRD